MEHRERNTPHVLPKLPNKPVQNEKDKETSSVPTFPPDYLLGQRGTSQGYKFRLGAPKSKAKFPKSCIPTPSHVPSTTQRIRNSIICNLCQMLGKRTVQYKFQALLIFQFFLCHGVGFQGDAAASECL